MKSWCPYTASFIQRRNFLSNQNHEGANSLSILRSNSDKKNTHEYKFHLYCKVTLRESCMWESTCLPLTFTVQEAKEGPFWGASVLFVGTAASYLIVLPPAAPRPFPHSMTLTDLSSNGTCVKLKLGPCTFVKILFAWQVFWICKVIRQEELLELPETSPEVSWKGFPEFNVS